MLKTIAPATIVRMTNKATALSVILAVCLLLPPNAGATGAFFLIDISARGGSSLADPARCSNQPVVASGLRAPVELAFTQHSNLLVAEMGAGTNSGRISIVDPATGDRRTLLDGLLSAFVPPSGVTSGPTGLALRGRTLYVSIGAGDTTAPGAAPHTRVPNPNPSSPLFSSVLAVDFTPRAEQTTGGYLWARQSTGVPDGRRRCSCATARLVRVISAAAISRRATARG